MVHILALFSKVICLCKFVESGFSSSFLYIASRILSLISLAAAFVNVTTKILSISTPSLITLLIIRSTKTAVLPLPSCSRYQYIISFFMNCLCLFLRPVHLFLLQSTLGTGLFLYFFPIWGQASFSTFVEFLAGLFVHLP